MKYLFSFLMLVLCGCGQSVKQEKIGLIETKDEGMVVKKLNYGGEHEIKEFEYEGCEYIVIGMYDRMTITHKGNCKYCQQRNK